MKIVKLLKPNVEKIKLSALAGLMGIIVFYIQQKLPICLMMMPIDCMKCEGFQYPNLIAQCYDGCNCTGFEEFINELFLAVIWPFILGFLIAYLLFFLIQSLNIKKT
jgi:hypothetical protein